MAPVSAALALKAATVVAFLAMLVVPSFGRCGQYRAPPPQPSPTPPPPTAQPPPSTPSPTPSPSPPPPSPPPPSPPPPPPPPAPTPPPSPPSPAERLPASPAPAPGRGQTLSCDDCKSHCDDTCDDYASLQCVEPCEYSQDACDGCNAGGQRACYMSACGGSCEPCIHSSRQHCRDSCSKECSAPNCVPSVPAPAPVPVPVTCGGYACFDTCVKPCGDTVNSNCSSACSFSQDDCNSCTTKEDEKCRASHECTDGGCDDCGPIALNSCTDTCENPLCGPCRMELANKCAEPCWAQCYPPNCILP